jgi:ribosomal protein L15
MQGGFGRAGRYRHKRSRLIRTGEFRNLHYAGKKGFVSVAQKSPTGGTLNLWQLSAIADRLVSEKKAQLAGEKVIIDLKPLGIRKLLGAGSVSRALQVNVDECSEGALKKLKEAGGEAILKPEPAKPEATKATK